MLMSSKDPARELLRLLPRKEERERFDRDKQEFRLRQDKFAAQDPFS
jgi:hypothetical protein